MISGATDMVGYLAAAVLLGGYLLKDHRNLCVAVSLGLAIFAAHYAMLGSMTTAVMCVFSAVRYCVSPWALRHDHTTRLRLTAVAALIGILLCMATWQDWRSLVASVGTFILIAGGFHLKDNSFRKILLASDLAFVANAILVGSAPGLAMSACAILLNAGVMIRAGGKQSLALSK